MHRAFPTPQTLSFLLVLFSHPQALSVGTCRAPFFFWEVQPSDYKTEPGRATGRRGRLSITVLLLALVFLFSGGFKPLFVLHGFPEYFGRTIGRQRPHNRMLGHSPVWPKGVGSTALHHPGRIPHGTVGLSYSGRDGISPPGYVCLTRSATFHFIFLCLDLQDHSACRDVGTTGRINGSPHLELVCLGHPFLPTPFTFLWDNYFLVSKTGIEVPMFYRLRERKKTFVYKLDCFPWGKIFHSAFGQGWRQPAV